MLLCDSIAPGCEVLWSKHVIAMYPTRLVCIHTANTRQLHGKLMVRVEDTQSKLGQTDRPFTQERLLWVGPHRHCPLER
jgi:hypothetical protein